jgi:MFS family permease
MDQVQAAQEEDAYRDSYGGLLHQQNNGVQSMTSISDDSGLPLPKNTTSMPKEDATSSTASNNISYWQFLCQNRNYRWYIASFSLSHFGEWLTYISSIDFIETIREQQHRSTSRTAISILILVRLLPNVVLSALGGTLADSWDRRHIMIGLDVCGALCAGLFILAFEMESIGLLYFATAVQQCIAGLYNPSHSAIVPQLIETDAELKKATTLEGLTWSAMQAFGAAASGWIVDALGIRMCFVLDGISYAVSAVLLGFVRGSYRVVQEDKDSSLSSSTVDKSDIKQEAHKSTSPCQQYHTMVVDGVKYLQGSYFGGLIFLKGTAALGFGACDILNVAFSEQTSYSSEYNVDSEETMNAVSSNRKLGILFSLVGIGCLLGPLVADPWIDVGRPVTLQVSCIIAFGLSAVGYFGWAAIPSFWPVAIFAVIRAAGSSNIWIHSTLLLQKFSAPHMLGRVLAADYAIALVGEASAAYLCGSFMDHHTDWTPFDVSRVLALLTSVITMGWLIYHISGRGAGQYRYVPSLLISSESTKMISTARSNESTSLLGGHNVKDST